MSWRAAVLVCWPRMGFAPLDEGTNPFPFLSIPLIFPYLPRLSLRTVMCSSPVPHSQMNCCSSVSSCQGVSASVPDLSSSLRSIDSATPL